MTAATYYFLTLRKSPDLESARLVQGALLLEPTRDQAEIMRELTTSREEKDLWVVAKVRVEVVR